MKIIPKIVVAMFLTAGFSNYAGAVNNLLPSKINTYINKIVPAKIKLDNDKTIISIPEYSHDSNNFVQLIFYVQLEEGKTYKLKFNANSNKDGVIGIHYILNKVPYPDYVHKSIIIKIGEHKYEIEFTPRKVKGQYDSPRSLRFFMGKMTKSKIVISDISLGEIEK